MNAEYPHYSNPEQLMRPPAPYSQVSRAGDLVFLAGQTGSDANGRIVADDIGAQVEQTLENFHLALASQGLDLRHIARMTIYVAGREHLPAFAKAMDDVMARLFDGEYPPSTLLVVDGLAHPELLIEMDAVAYAPARRGERAPE